MNKIFLILGVMLLLVGSVNALNVNYYYSPTCPSCNSISPFIQSVYEKYNYHQWRFIDVTKQQTDIRSVPTLIIEDKILTGSRDIPEKAEVYLNCNPTIQPQTTCYNGNKQTLATPNHQRPCSVKILFGENK
jgi:thiol-disulfide isomerase/thioredoxin